MDIERINSIKDEYLQNYRAKQVPIIEEGIDDYIQWQKQELENLSVTEAKCFLISAANERCRRRMKSCREFGLWITPGDVVFADFGAAYVSEIGYQHLAIVINVFCGKALIIPMSSNRQAIMKAYDEKTNPCGLRHLMRTGRMPGLHRESVLFLNDAKYINTARIIDIKGHMETDGEQFLRISKRVLECMTSPDPGVLL